MPRVAADLLTAESIPSDPAARIEFVGKELFGRRWKTALAARLMVSRESLKNWLQRPPRDIDQRLLVAVDSVLRETSEVSRLRWLLDSRMRGTRS